MVRGERGQAKGSLPLEIARCTRVNILRVENGTRPAAIARGGEHGLSNLALVKIDFEKTPRSGSRIGSITT
jgi:hypothetical protein